MRISESGVATRLHEDFQTILGIFLDQLAPVVRVDKDGDAPMRAAQRADELLDDGDVEGSAVWRRILEAIEELQRTRREGESLN